MRITAPGTANCPGRLTQLVTKLGSIDSIGDGNGSFMVKLLSDPRKGWIDPKKTGEITIYLTSALSNPQS